MSYVVNDETGCWEWTGPKLAGGYGQINLSDRTVCAHRWMYEQAKGTIPPGLVIDHLCRNRGCVNPEHMEPVTNAENARRGVKTILNADQVRSIRSMRGKASVPEIAGTLGVPKAAVQNVLSGHTWKDIH